MVVCFYSIISSFAYVHSIYRIYQIACIHVYIGSHQGPHEKRLLTKLLTDYNILERPVSNESDALTVRFGLTLQQIIDVVSIPVRMLNIILEILSACKRWKNQQTTGKNKKKQKQQFGLLLWIPFNHTFLEQHFRHSYHLYASCTVSSSISRFLGDAEFFSRSFPTLTYSNTKTMTTSFHFHTGFLINIFFTHSITHLFFSLFSHFRMKKIKFSQRMRGWIWYVQRIEAKKYMQKTQFDWILFPWMEIVIIIVDEQTLHPSNRHYYQFRHYRSLSFAPNFIISYQPFALISTICSLVFSHSPPKPGLSFSFGRIVFVEFPIKWCKLNALNTHHSKCYSVTHAFIGGLDKNAIQNEN